MADAKFISANRLREVVNYDPQTGLFTWATPRFKCRPGDVAGNSSHPRGYIQIRLDYRRYYAHRLAWLYVYGVWPEAVIDHINGCTSDNRIENLRDVSQRSNNENHRCSSSKAAVPLLGVSLNRKTGRYVAQIRIQGRQTGLGYFDTAEQAHAAYIAAKRQHHAASTI